MVHALSTGAQVGLEDQENPQHDPMSTELQCAVLQNARLPIDPPCQTVANDAPLIPAQIESRVDVLSAGPQQGTITDLDTKAGDGIDIDRINIGHTEAQATQTLPVFTELSLIWARQDAGPRMAPGVGGFNIEPPPVRASPLGSECVRVQPRKSRNLLLMTQLPTETTRLKRGTLRGWLVTSSLVGCLLAFAGLGQASFHDRIPNLVREFTNIALPLFGSPNTDSPTYPARLVIAGQSGFVNEPLPVGISLQDFSGDETVVVSGLIGGTELSLGTSLGRDGWTISARDVDRTFVGAPKDFFGVMTATVDLRSPTGRLLDRGNLRLEWSEQPTGLPASPLALRDTPETLVPVVEAHPNPTSQGVMATRPDPTVATKPTEAIKPTEATRPEPVEPTLPPNPDQAATLLQLAWAALKVGDIATTRMLLKRAADLGDAQAALELGMSFDPVFLGKLGIVGIAPDVAQAVEWYNKASALGSAEATRHLNRLARLP